MSHDHLKKITDTLWRIPHDDAESVLSDLLTPSEIEAIAERLEIISLLKQGKTQRDIAQELWISVTTVSRWSRILKYGTGAIEKYVI